MSETLAEENRAQHEWLDERLLVFVELLTELRFDDAAVELERFVAVLDRHMAFEDTHSIPALRAQLPEGKESELLIKQIDGDHIIIKRTLGRVRASLATVRETGTRRALVLELDTFLLLGRVLEHHTAREQRDLYPRLDDELSAETRIAMLAELRSTGENP